MILKILFSLFLILQFLLSPNAVSAQEPPKPSVDKKYSAEITKLIEEKSIFIFENEQKYKKFELKITSGDKKGETITSEVGDLPTLQNIEYKVGDNVILTAIESPQGEVFYISDYERSNSLLILFILFAVLVIIIGKKRGLFSLLGMAISFLIIFFFILPQILAGNNPVFIAIIGSLMIIPFTFYLSHGFDKKTNAAVISTFISLIITGVLASYFVDINHLTGFASEEANFLQTVKAGTINIKALLLAGIIVGILGILDDITISQSAIISELHKTSPNLTASELYKKGMNIGRDHIASLVNTLILVYTGAAMPLLLLFTTSDQTFSQIISFEAVSEEIVRTLVASISLILSVPIATLVAILLIPKKFKF